MLKRTVTLIALLLIAGSAFGAVVTTYTNKSAWNTATYANALVQPLNSENFGDTILEPWVTITSSTNVPYSVGIYTSQWHSIVDNSPVKEDIFTMMYGGTKAWIANFDLSPGGLGTGIAIYADFVGGGAGYQLIGVLSTGSGPGGEYVGDFGFIADSVFYSVKLVGDSGCCQETYLLDDMNIAFIPEPATYGLMGLGLAGLTLLRRRKA